MMNEQHGDLWANFCSRVKILSQKTALRRFAAKKSRLITLGGSPSAGRG
jgi:hypothetical protein